MSAKVFPAAVEDQHFPIGIVWSDGKVTRFRSRGGADRMLKHTAGWLRMYGRIYRDAPRPTCVVRVKHWK